MNPMGALAVIINTSRQHPWLLAVVILALISHACDLQWPDYHKLFSTIGKGMFAIAFLYAGGTSLTPKPTDPPKP